MPMQLARFSRFRLAHLPTPLEPMAHLSRHLGGPRLFVKRDDCTGLALGGNKTRKLEFLVGDALAKGATMLVSEGGVQSNHVRQTAAAAARAGLKCALVLERAVPWPEPAYETSGNILLDRLLGAEVHLCAPGESRAARSPAVVAAARAAGEVPCFVPTGGSNGIGALGYVDCALELLDQARNRDLTIDAVVVASGSGGTHGGLLVGLIGAASGVRVIGIDIDNAPDKVRADVARVAHEAAGLLGIEATLSGDAIDVRAGYAAPGYGLPNPATIEAMRLAARLEGLILDPVYSGKAMAGLIDLVRRGAFAQDESVVFLHTGGAPALFTYAGAFGEG